MNTMYSYRFLIYIVNPMCLHEDAADLIDCDDETMAETCPNICVGGNNYTLKK